MMKPLLSSLATALALALTPAVVLAQAAAAPAPAASGPGMHGCMQGMQGPHCMHQGGKGMRHGPRATARNTPGWQLMTPEERNAHRDKMMGMKSADECKAYMTEHHEQMAARAKEKGVAMPAMPRRDACGGLPKS